MKIHVVGAGAMGCLYAGAFHRAGCDVTLVDINAAHLEAIQSHGVELETRSGIDRLALPACRPEEAQGTTDLVLLFTKTFHTDAALEGVRQIIGPATHVLTLQNGLGNDDRVASHVARDRVLVGVSTLPADLIAPGKVRSLGEGGSKLYPAFGGDPAFAGEVAEALNRGGLPSTLDPEIDAAIWAKAIFNAAMNPLCALTRRTPGFLAAHEESRELIRISVEEGVATARANGVEIAADAIHALTEISMTDHADHEASMLQDIKAGRHTEIDAINGAIARIAQAKAVNVPVTATLWRLVKLEEAKLSA